METGSSGRKSSEEDPITPKSGHKMSAKEDSPSLTNNQKEVTIVDKKTPGVFAFKKKIEQLFSFNIPFENRKKKFINLTSMLYRFNK